MASSEKQELVGGSEGLPKRIYILGVGNIGTFIAHSLAGIPNRPPITLLLRRPERLRDYKAQGGVLKLTTHNMTQSRRGFEVEALNWREQSPSKPISLEQDEGRNSRDSHEQNSLLDVHDQGPETRDAMINAPSPPFQYSQSSSQDDMDFESQYASNGEVVPFDEAREKNVSSFKVDSEGNQFLGNRQDQDSRSDVIYHLIVAVKAPHTVNAIRPYAHRLTSQSTILFVQNGMGVIDEVNEAIFPSEEDRPHYMVGVLSHGLHGKEPFDVVHAGEGTLALGLLAEKEQYPASARYLLRTMTRTPVLVAMGMNPTELFQQQLDKLAVNAVINPMTALLDCLNSQLLDSFYVTRVMRLLLAEISVVFRSLPELKNVLNVNMRFDTARLEALVIRVAKLTGPNRSSMLQDLKAGRETEIDYINGYIVRRGEERGIHCVTNYSIMQMVKAKKKMIQLELDGTVPLHPSVQPK